MIDKIVKTYSRDRILHSFLLYDYIFLQDRTKLTYTNDTKYILTYYNPPYRNCSIYIYTDKVDIETLKEHVEYCKEKECNSFYIYGNIDTILDKLRSIFRERSIFRKCFLVMSLDKNSFRKIPPRVENVVIRKIDLDNKNDYNMFKTFLEKYFKISEDYIKYFKNDRIFAAVRDNEILSIARICLILPETCLIAGVFTIPEFRGRGLAGAVLSSLCENALQLGIIPFLFVDHENAPAIRLYRKLGFRSHITMPYLKIV
ncbi:MAG: GNAT family N-acetyltransferase [Crenarchaeota archaeon]|nr:GNAT family N-acetyltransferase [Thermoproteota archaeon]